MTQNNFKVAARVLWNQKTNTILNVLSLAIGLACFLMISIYLKQEISFDKFHENADRIYRVWAKEDYGEGREFFYTTSPLPLAPALAENIPEVDGTVQYDYTRLLVGEGQERINESIAVVSSNFFDVFSFEIVAGNSNSPLSDPNGVVLTERYAIKYFGNKSPIGEELSIEVGSEQLKYTVSAIAKDPPKNSGFQFNIVVSNELKTRYYSGQMLQSWFGISPETYILVNENTSRETIEEKLPMVVKKALGGRVQDGEYVLGLQALSSIHLDPEYPAGILPVGNPKYVYVLGVIGVLVLFMACINYTTLSTGQSIKRSKEVGIRKVVGAQQRSLIWYFLSEGILTSFLATIVGVIVAFLLMPVFNNLAGTDLVIPLNVNSLLSFIALALGLGVLTGFYPAFVLSKLKLMSVLRSGKQGKIGGDWFRKSLVVFQLLLTVFLITSNLIMRKQMNYMLNSDLGFQHEAFISVNLFGSQSPTGMSQNIMSGFENAKILKSVLLSNPSVSSIAVGNHVFGNPGWTEVGFNDKQGQFKQFTLLITDPFYISSFGIKMQDGRAFNPMMELDERESVILNRAAAEYLGLDDPVGKKLPGDGFGNHTIIGVTENFHFQSLRTEVEPLVIVQNARMIFQGINDVSINGNPLPKLVFKYTGSNLTEVSTILEEAWGKTFPNQDLQFSFLDEQMELMYQEESRVNKISSIATVISILIAAFGLLGLTILVVNTKVKEIGIRKVLGASPVRIFRLLFKGFSIQLVVAILLSVPITYLLMKDWLNDFAYKISIGLKEFTLSGLLALIIVLLVISYHAIKASKSNPVKALRIE